MANLFDLQQYKCKTCGEPLDISMAQNGVIKCGVCDSVFTLPKDDTPSAALNFIRAGEHDLDTCKFDDAYMAYSKAAELSAKEPEAYFGMALAEFKIQYLKDEVNNKLQPICHEVTDKVFADSANFLKALRYATDEQRKEYERKAEEIEYIMTEFFKLKKSGIDYDCFICVKVSDDNGGTTEDSEFAHKIYRMLKKNSYEPFYSEAVLKNVTGADYEAHILYALASSETMLIVCFDEGYLRTKWVKNEYTRYLKLVNDEEKESDSITVVYKGKPIEKLPNRKGKLQGIDADELDFSARILKFVDTHTPEAKKRREEEAKRKSEESDALKKELAEQKERARRQEELLKKLMDRFNEPTLSDEARLEQEKAREEAERKQKEEAEKKAAEEKARKEARARVEAERKAQEEERARQLAAKKAAEEKAAQEQAAVEAARLERKRKAAVDRVKKDAELKAENDKRMQEIERDFEIENGVLIKYKGEAVRKAWGITEPIEVVIPDIVKKIGDSAFRGCNLVISIAIGASVKNIHYRAFWECPNLLTLTVDEKNTVYESAGNCIIEKKSKTLIVGCNGSVIPNDVGVSQIGSSAFFYCKKLTHIDLPQSVSVIGSFAFSGCAGLTVVTIPYGVTALPQSAFSNCYGITEISIPESVTEIGVDAFLNCNKLAAIIYSGTKRQWRKIKKGKNWDKGTGKYTVEFDDMPNGWAKKFKYDI